MVDFSFRLRFLIPPSRAVNIDESYVALSGPHHPSLTLGADPKETPIKETKALILKGTGHASEDEAISTGERFRDALILTLAHCRIGADFGDRDSHRGFTRNGIREIEDRTGQKVLNDLYGLMAFPTMPPPGFVRVGEPTLILVTPGEHFVDAFSKAAQANYSLTERERLSYMLYTASFFERSQEARLLFLVMSVEALTEPLPRPSTAAAHVDTLIQLTRNAPTLSKSEKDSLLGSLEWLRQESIRQASRRLISTKLGDKTYDNKPATDYFLQCYDLRSDLLHGADPYPTMAQVGSASANLEVLVADLIAAPVDWASA